MSMYLGELGRMVELKCAASLSTSPADRYSLREDISGGVRGYARPHAPRTWDLSFPDATTPEEIASLEAFVMGEWGDGPWKFITPDAKLTNMLSAETSTLSPNVLHTGVASEGGPQQLPDGTWAGRSWNYVGSGSTLFLGPVEDGATLRGERIPAIPGETYTFSTYVAGSGGVLRVAWYDGADALVSFTDSPGASGAALEHLSLTLEAPAGAVAFRMMCPDTGITHLARPAATMTGEVVPWTAGQGCPWGIVRGYTRNLVMASGTGRRDVLSGASFQIQEVV